jgi:hypothetical protein
MDETHVQEKPKQIRSVSRGTPSKIRDPEPMQEDTKTDRLHPTEKSHRETTSDSEPTIQHDRSGKSDRGEKTPDSGIVTTSATPTDSSVTSVLPPHSTSNHIRSKTIRYALADAARTLLNSDNGENSMSDVVDVGKHEHQRRDPDAVESDKSVGSSDQQIDSKVKSEPPVQATPKIKTEASAKTRERTRVPIKIIDSPPNQVKEDHYFVISGKDSSKDYTQILGNEDESEYDRFSRDLDDLEKEEDELFAKAQRTNSPSNGKHSTNGKHSANGNHSSNSVLHRSDGPPNLQIFTCKNHHTTLGHYPATVVVARTADDAVRVLDLELKKMGFHTSTQTPYKLEYIDLECVPRGEVMSFSGGTTKTVGTFITLPEPGFRPELGFRPGSESRPADRPPKGTFGHTKLFTCTDHYSKYPVAPASYVVARDAFEAIKHLDKLFTQVGGKAMDHFPYTLNEISLTRPGAYILFSGQPGGV